MRQFKQGDRVAYSAEFCRSVSAQTGDIPHSRGIVQAVSQLHHGRQLVTIKWDNPHMPEKVLNANLAIVGPNAEFCRC